MTQITITIAPTFRGYLVKTDTPPSRSDPLGQRPGHEHFQTIDEAVDALPRIARERLEHVDASGR